MKAFTLTELMTVLAIISVLAAIAIPNFYDAQLRSRYAEVKTLAPHALDVALMYYEATDLDYSDPVTLPSTTTVPLATCPSGGVSKQKKSFAVCLPDYIAYMSLVGFEPDGEVYGSYTIASGASGSLGDTTCPGQSAGSEPMIWSRAYTNLDGDAGLGTTFCCAGGTGSNYGYEQSGVCGRSNGNW